MPRGITDGDIICPGCSKRLRPLRRYPFAPLAAFVGMSQGQAALRLDLSGGTQKAARCDGLTRQNIDTICGKLRIHPSEVWPEIVGHDIEDLSKACAECGERFIGRRSDAIYCSEQCRRRVSSRRYSARKAGDPRVKERKRKYMADHYEECKDYRLRWQADYYRRNREARIKYMRQRRAAQREAA